MEVNATFCLLQTMLYTDANRGTRGVMVIIVGNGHSDMSLNPGQDIAFHIALIPLGKV